MKIAVIGTGKVGSTLAIAFKKAGHEVVFGVRDPSGNFSGKEVATAAGIQWHSIPDAAAQADVLVLSVPAQTAHEVAAQLGNVAGKVIIDSMNAIGQKPAGYPNTAAAILANCNATDLAKCFNSTGFENMANPVYHGEKIDMFVAGNSEKAIATATTLAKDISFGEVYNFGGIDKFEVLRR